MNLTEIKLDYTAKPKLRELASLVGVSFVDTGTHKRKPCAIFSKGNYKAGFAEIILFSEDLTLDNFKLMLEYGSTR